MTQSGHRLRHQSSGFRSGIFTDTMRSERWGRNEAAGVHCCFWRCGELAACRARTAAGTSSRWFFYPELSGKRLQLLKEIIDGLSRVAALWNPDDPPAVLSLKETEAAARQLGIEVAPIEARRPEDFETSFASAINIHVGAVVVLSAPIMTVYAGQIAQLARRNGLPTISNASELPKAGGLMSYGPNIDDLCRSAAIYVDNILKGARPADLPVAQPTKFELVLNLKTAKTLGLTIPPGILSIADEVIE
jgi:putative tryptophan/tyrosine transport system substrate-binding protein